MAKKYYNIRSINSNIIASFLIILCVILALIWILEVLCFDGIFQSIKSREVQNTARLAVGFYENNDEDSLLELSVMNDCNIVIFTRDHTIAGDMYQVRFTTSRISDEQDLMLSIRLFMRTIGDETAVGFMNNSYEQDNTYIYGIKQMNSNLNEPVYYYVSSVVTPASYTVNVIVYLLLIITAVSLVLMFVLSYVFSRRLAKPITQIAEEAKQISAGNLDVKFNNREFKEISELTDTLNYAIGEIQKGENLRKEVIANVSHELRTPLTMIKSYAEMIGDISGDDPKKRAEHLKVIIEEADRLEYLVNDILDLSKMQSGTISYQFEKFNLSESLEKFEKFYAEKFKDFMFSFEYPKRVYVFGDKKRIEQVIINLLNNAINYSDKVKDVSVRLFRTNGKYRFEVTDKGIGIGKEEQKYIFDRHFRATSARRATTGSGIGLSIAKEILTYHNFDYGVISEVGEGSTFYFEFS